MLKQRSQKTTWSRTATSAAARVRASSSAALRRWYVRRWAVFGPIPGKRANESMSRATGSMRGVATRRSHPRDAQTAGHGGHLLLGEFTRGTQGVVDRRDDEVLEHLDIGRVHGAGIDRDAHDFLLARDRCADDTAAGRAYDRGSRELILDAQRLALHLLDHLLQVGHAHRR